ncbi:hypothetical protein HY632_01080 [Candidatus Uhrbacteria bacterium]|nr:hypothetical protein [Candidatus Uhrbacteria bacterium]
MITTRSRSEVSVLAGLICFGVLAVILGTSNLKRLIAPARRGAEASAIAEIPRSLEEFEEKQRGVRAAADTDGDGLSDLEEFERIHTSPFLADSDSDGRTDKQEVDAGEDPNCPTGQVCTAGVGGGDEASVPAVAASIAIPGIGGALPPISGTASVTGDVPELNPADVRRMLAQQGMPQQIIDSISDAEINRTYRSTLAAIEKLPTGEGNNFSGALRESFTQAFREQPATPNAALDQLPSDPASIRKILAQGGFSQEQLKLLDDATLMQVWKDVVKQLRQEQGPLVGSQTGS